MIYDLVIIGGGSGGLSAAIYAGRSEMKTLVIEQGAYGGRIRDTNELMNYPGVPYISGSDLMADFKKHAELFPSVEWLRTTVKDIEELDEGIKLVKTGRRGDFKTKSIIINTGTKPRILGIPGEKEFVGKGVAYCATCDAKFFQDKEVFILGAGNQAIEEAQFITKFASKVTIVVIHEEGKLDCDRVAAEQAFANPKINFIWNSTLAAVEGNEEVEKVKVRNIRTDEVTEYNTSGVFFFVGMIPQTEFVKDLLSLNKAGFIKTDEEMKTNIDGIYAIGDCRDTYLRQVITAASDGAIAAVSAERYVNEKDYLSKIMSDKNSKLAFIFYTPYEDKSLKRAGAIEKIVNKDYIPILQDISKQKGLYSKLGLVNDLALAIYEGGKFKEILDFDDESYKNYIK